MHELLRNLVLFKENSAEGLTVVKQNDVMAPGCIQTDFVLSLTALCDSMK